MTFEEYLELAIKQLKAMKDATLEHYETCTEICPGCSMHSLIEPSISFIELALKSEEAGLCDDPACINNVAYNIAQSIFNEMDRKIDNNVETN